MDRLDEAEVAFRHAVAVAPADARPSLSLAQNLLSAFGRAEAMTLVLVLTDGEQTVWGGDNAAMAAAEDLKATGTSVVTLSLGMQRTQPNRHLPPPASA